MGFNLAYATAECFYCHKRLPKPDMYSDEVSVKSGKSGFSAGISPFSKSKGKNLRVNTGRNYYRQKTIWYCENCKVKHASGSTLMVALFWDLPVLIFIKLPFLYPLKFAWFVLSSLFRFVFK